MARGNAPGVRNPVTLLPAASELAALPPEVRATLARLFSQLSSAARGNASKAWRTHKAPMAAYWKACAVYARHIALVLKGKAPVTPAAHREDANRLAEFADACRAILEDPHNSGADCYDHIAGLLRDIGRPVREPDEIEDDACPDDPDGLHHVGCGCDHEPN